MKHETKRLSFKMDEYDEEEGIFSGYGAVFANIDSGGGHIEPGALAKGVAGGWGGGKNLGLAKKRWLPVGKRVGPPGGGKGVFS